MEIWKDFCKQAVTSTTGSPTTAFTLGSAPSGFQALASGDNGGTGFFSVTEGSTWQTFLGTYTHSGTSLAVSSFIASSSGSALTFTSAAVVRLDVVSQCAQAMSLANQGIQPGGRLTLTTAVPVTSADVTGAGTLYYTPYVSNTITLWDGNRWVPTIFAEIPKSLGTLTNNQGYDALAFLNSGAADLEFMAWTNNTTPAAAPTVQDGRLCKSSDKTRLYLGSFLTTSTTTTEDSFVNRYLFNMYNRAQRIAKITSNNTHTYNSVTERNWNNSATDTACNCFIGIVDQAILFNGYTRGGDLSAGVTPVNNITAIRFNGTTYGDTQGQVYFYTTASGSKVVGAQTPIGAAFPALGLNTLIMREIDGSTGGTGSTFSSATTMMRFIG